VALTRDMANPLVYNTEAVADPIVRDLARRIELVPVADDRHESPGVWPAEILIEAPGQRHALHTRPHKGAPSNPFTSDEAREKFGRYTASLLDAKRSSTIIDALGRCEQLTDMAAVADLLRHSLSAAGSDGW
jgi:2-methylcitrate dehydratase PrpD